MFKLSENIDPNKVFIVNRSELIGKLSPNIYANNFHFKSKIYPLFKLADLAFINPTTTFSNIQQQEDITFIPMEAVNQNLGIIDVEYTKKIEETKGYTRFKENDLIWAKITPCMQNGKSAIVRNTINGYACGSTEFFIIRCKTNTILIEYIHFILRDKRILKTAMNFFGGSAGQQRVSKDFLLNLLIPLPPLEIQQQIVDLYEKAYSEKQQKEAEAQRLLDSIDNYLLGELGITLPKEEELLPQNTDKNNSYNLDNDYPLVKKGRLFLTNLSEVTGKRIDPKGYDIKTKLLKSSIDNIDLKKFILLPLKSFIIQSIAGNWGIDEKEEIEDNEEYQKCLVIRATEFDNQYNLNLDNSRVKYRLIKKSILSKIDLKENDLLIEKSGGSPDQPVGRIAIITENIIKNNILCYSNFIHKIRVDNKKINPEYLFCFLKMMHNIRLTEAMQSQTNGIRNLIMNSYLNQNIIIPISENGKIDIQKQTEIANIITAIREKAKKLQLEAINTLETAKRNIEQMILGN